MAKESHVRFHAGLSLVAFPSHHLKVQEHTAASSRRMGGGTPGVLGRGRDSAGQSCCSFPVRSCNPLTPLFSTPLSSHICFFHFLAGIVSEPKVSGNTADS